MQFIKLDSNEKSNVGLLENYTKNLSILEFMEIEAGGTHWTQQAPGILEGGGWKRECFAFIIFVFLLTRG